MLALFGSTPVICALAQLAAAAGQQVRVVEADQSIQEDIMLRVGGGLTLRVDKGLMSAEACLQSTQRVQVVAPEELGSIDFAIYSDAREDPDAIERWVNTEKDLPLRVPLALALESGRCFREWASRLRYPQRTVGLSFPFDQVLSSTVEVARELRTRPHALKAWHEYLQKLGLTPVHVAAQPGLLASRLQFAWLSECWRILEAEAVDAGTLDALMRDAGGFKTGPCEWLDAIGHHVVLDRHRRLHQQRHGDLRYEPHLMQESMVLANRLGKHSGQGFFEYGLTATSPTATIESAGHFVSGVQVMGNLGPARALVDRVASADILTEHIAPNGGAPCIVAGPARLVLTDGRSATQVAHEDRYPNMVVYDLCHNFLTSRRIAVARASQCSDVAYGHAVGFFQQCGFEVSRIGDIPGLPVSSAVCALINESADCVFDNVGSAKDCDDVMHLAFGHPLGPLRWCDELGVDYVARLIENLAYTYGTVRHHVSALLRHKTWANKKFYESSRPA